MTTTIFPRDIPGHIRALRAFLTQAEIDKATAALRERERNCGIVKRMKLREVQPWLYALDSCRKLTLGGNRLPKMWPAIVQSLAVGGLAVPVITMSMSDAVRRHHRASLLCLNGGHAPCVAEWSAAYFYATTHKASIAWSEPNNGGADFVARAGDVVFEVECKRYGSMIVELFGDSEVEVLADMVFAVFKEQQVHGVLDVVAKTYPNVDASAALNQLRGLASGPVFPVNVAIDEPGLSITGVLRRSGPEGDPVTGFAELEDIPDDVRSFGTASRINGGPSNLRLIRIAGPRRSPTELGEYLLEKMADAAENQLSGNAGGVLVLEFARVEDPTVFRDNLGVRRMLNELFGRYRHLAAIVLRAAQVSKLHENHSEMNQFAYVEKSAVTSFPDVANLPHLSKS